ncbi:MAG: hypothetical protein LBK61_08810 [Spirochaetaceae bacterium]|nr:hypothetical protein [Spirochaetaceae bacterium]
MRKRGRGVQKPCPAERVSGKTADAGGKPAARAVCANRNNRPEKERSCEEGGPGEAGGPPARTAALFCPYAGVRDTAFWGAAWGTGGTDRAEGGKPWVGPLCPAGARGGHGDSLGFSGIRRGREQVRQTP